MIDLNSVEIKDITKRLSKSKLNTFKTCPRQYWFSAYFPEQAAPSPAMIRGVRLHNLFDDIFKVEEIKDIKSRLSFLEQTQNLKNANLFTKELEKFATFQEQLGFIFPESCEEKIYDEEEDLVIKWDRIDFDGEHRVIWDYKSGQLKDVTDFWYELGIYALIYMKKTGKRVHYVGIYFMDHGTYDLIEVTEEYMIKVLTEIYNDKSELKSCQDNNNWPTNKGMHCNWCRWKTKCPAYNKKW